MGYENVVGSWFGWNWCWWYLLLWWYRKVGLEWVGDGGCCLDIIVVVSVVGVDFD